MSSASPSKKSYEYDPNSYLFVVQSMGEYPDEYDSTYVVAPSLSAALNKWKEIVAQHITEDYVSEGITDRVITVDDVDDPESITLVASPGELML